MNIYGQRSINRSFEWLNVPAPFCDTGVAWTDKLLVPEGHWEDGVTVETWTLGTQSGVHFGGVDVHWCGAIPFRAVYLPMSPENSHATARRVCDVRLRENRLSRSQNLLYAHHIGGNEWVNRSNDNWDGWVDQ